MKNIEGNNCTVNTPLNVSVSNSTDESITEQMFSDQKPGDPSSSSIRGQCYHVPSLWEDRHNSKGREQL